MPKIVVQEGQKQRIFEYEGGRVTFGQSKAVIALKAQGISDLHCEITDTPEGFRLKDLESKQGTKLNGKSISTAYLRDGDEIHIGKIKITFWEGEVGDSKPDKLDKHSNTRHEEERPRRRRSSQSNPLLALLSVLIGIGIIVAVLFATNAYFSENARIETLFLTGRNAFDRGDYQKAIDCFSQIDPDFPTYGKMAQEKYKEAQIRKAKAESGTRLRELRTDLYRIFKEIGHNKSDPEGNKQKLKEWIQAHATDSPALAKEAQDEIDRIEQGPTYSEEDRPIRSSDPEDEDSETEAKTPEEELTKILAQINSVLTQKRFKEAIDPLNAFKQKYPLNTKLRKQADEKIEAIYEDARAQYQKILEKVNTLTNQGKKQEAKKELQQVIQSFGLDFYVSSAKTEMKKLE